MHNNKGVSAATNKGLEALTGKYFMLADSDDILEKDCVLKKVEFLEKNPEISIVAAKARIVNENNLKKTIGYLYNKSKNWCDDIIFKGGVVCNGGIYMIKTESFLKIYPKRKIFESKFGQNYQILIPMSYYFDYSNINDIVYTYVVRDESLSHKQMSVELMLERYDGYAKILYNVTKLLPKYYRVDFMDKVCNYYAIEKFNCSLKYNNYNLVKKTFQKLIELHLVNFKHVRRYLKYIIKNSLYFK